MNGQAILTQFHNIIDDQPDQDFSLQILNIVKDRWEDSRDWVFLRDVDSTQTANTSDTYTTFHSLPSTFRSPRQLFLDGMVRPLTPVPFELREQKKDYWGHWYIDYANDRYALTGKQGATKTIHLFFVKTTDDVTLTTSPSWPSRFHKIIAFLMAGYYKGGVDDDVDGLAQRLSQQDRLIFDELALQMERWDDQQQTFALNFGGNQAPDLSSHPDIIDPSRP